MPSSTLLLEHILHKTSLWAIRFFQDGHVEEYSDQTLSFENNQIVSREQAPEWRPLTVLSEDEMDALKEAIRHSGMLDLPAVVGDPAKVHDGTVVEWYANLGGRENRLKAWEPQASKNPGLKELGVAVQTITASAFKRDAG